MLKLSKGVSVAAMVPVADFGVAPPGSRTADAAAAERDVVMLTRQVGGRVGAPPPLPLLLHLLLLPCWAGPSRAALAPELPAQQSHGACVCPRFMLARPPWQGLIKRMPLKQFKAINKSGLAAIGIKVRLL